ncbi:MAG: sigma-70 family RNA polymerase sigma factor [Campylobacterota bacterium]|nr:sigma-70 family RNA polymerase sigma factor [Campylobacterota bacterium]
MDIIDQLMMGLVAILFVIVFTLLSKNAKLRGENKKLKEILEIKNTTISNYEASRASVKDVIENFSSLDDVMRLIDAGESKASVSEKLGIPVSKIDLIIKFDKLKKRD